MTGLIHKMLGHGDHTCPWWLCFTFDNPARKLIQNPYRILKGHIREGYSILDVGPGMGYFTFPLSEMAGPSGKVVALDIQQGMLKRLEKRVGIRGRNNIITRLYDGTRFNLEDRFDFVLLFWMYHEVNDKPGFVSEIKSVMKNGAEILIAEPKLHVGRNSFDTSLEILKNTGFKAVSEPSVPLSRAVLMKHTG